MMFNHADFSDNALFQNASTCNLTQLVPLKITSQLHNDCVNMGDFFINISRFEDILDLKYMLICFLVIKHTISFEFVTFTHTMMIGQLHTSSIDLYVKHAYLYNNTQTEFVSIPLSTFMSTFGYFKKIVRSRGCRDNGCGCLDNGCGLQYYFC